IAVHSHIQQQVSRLHFTSPIASLLLENNTLQPGAHFSLGKRYASLKTHVMQPMRATGEM
ncbi:hypothetical protein A6R68_23795, partial [Neotoma lepida]